MKPVFLVRLVIASLLVLALFQVGARPLARALLPLLHAAFSWVAEDYDVQRFELIEERANVSIGGLAVLKRSLFIGDIAIVPDGTQAMIVGTTVGTMMQPLLVLAVLVLAWPGRPAEMLVRVAIALALGMVLLAFDTPYVLSAWLWSAQLKAYAPGTHSWLVAWSVFLNGGGRLALGLVAAALSIAAGQRVARHCAPAQTAG